MKLDRLIGIFSILLQGNKVTMPYLAETFEVSRPRLLALKYYKKVCFFARGQEKQICQKSRAKTLLFGGDSGKIIQTAGFQTNLLKSIRFCILGICWNF